MIIYNEIEEFFKGVDFFNEHKYREAHEIWEHSWKRLGRKSNRLYLKPFIMLAVSQQNYKYNKNAGGQYLLQLALDRLLEYEIELKELVEVNSLIMSIKEVCERGGSAEAFRDVYIKKWGRFHNDLGSK